MENALYSFYSLVVLYHKTHSFAALTRSYSLYTSWKVRAYGFYSRVMKYHKTNE